MSIFLNEVDSYIYIKYCENYLYNISRLNNIFLTAPFFYFRNDFLLKLYINKSIKISSFIEKNNKKYMFLIDQGWFVKNPEFLNNYELFKIKKILKSNPLDFYALSAYIIYHYNNVDLNLWEYFDRFFEIEPNNPHMLLRLSRYQASTLYKKYNYDKKYLILWKNNILKLLREFKKYNKSDEIPTFSYSWLWFIEEELWNYNEAIRLYDYTIKLNKWISIDVPEPYVWKWFTLNKLLKYTESLDLLLKLEQDDKINEYNDKRDFRLYKVISDNYYNLWEYKLFYKNLKITIEKFLEVFSFHFNNWNYILDKNNFKLIFNNRLDINSYNSFLDYNKMYIKSNIDYIIFGISFLYNKKLIWKKITFNDSRGIERLCFNYLELIYEWKI